MQQQPVNRKFGLETFFLPWPAFSIGVVVFLIGSFLYVWLRVQPLLEYHSYGPYFYGHRIFLDTFLGRPGGLANYAGVFLAQFNCLNWLGALVFVISECAVFLTAHFCLARIYGRVSGMITLVPLFFLLLLRNRYGSLVPAISIGLLLALAAFAAHTLLPGRRPWLSTAVSGLISGLLFYVAGVWSALLFAVLCSLFIIIQKRNWPAGLGCLVLALVVPLLTIGAGKLEFAALLNPWPKGVDWFLATALYASVPIAGAVLTFLPKLATTPPAPLPESWFQTAARRKAVVVLAFLLGWAVVWLTFDRHQKFLAEIDYNATYGRYEAVLAAARQIPALNDPAKIRLQLALYHTGRLPEELFSFHNMIADTASEEIGDGCRAQSLPLFELGLLNDAEHMACESLVMEGERPDILRLLARINLLKNQPQAAQVFLNVLSLIPFQRERANDAWPAMNSRTPITDRALPARMPIQVLTNDVVHEGLPLGNLLDVLLVSNPTNQMAFEYAMAEYLLDLDLKNMVEHLQLLANFNYTQIPRSYEEALLLFQQIAGVKVELHGRAIRPETAERFRRFKEAARQFKGGVEDQVAMAANFSDTYWYYYYASRARARAAAAQSSTP